MTALRPTLRRLRQMGGPLHRASADAGFTMIELLVATTMSLVVLSAVLLMLTSSQNVQASDTEWATMIQEARTSLSTMTHEIRQAFAIKETQHSKLVFYADIGTTETAIEYNCDVEDTSAEYTEKGTKYKYKECVRKAVSLGKSETAEEATKALAAAKAVTIIRYVLNDTPADEPESKEDPIFQHFSPNAITPDLVTIRLVVPARGTLKLAFAEPYKHHVVLSDGAYIRNMALGA